MTALTLQRGVRVWQRSAAVTADVTTLMLLILVKIISAIHSGFDKLNNIQGL